MGVDGQSLGWGRGALEGGIWRAVYKIYCEQNTMHFLATTDKLSENVKLTDPKSDAQRWNSRTRQLQLEFQVNDGTGI